MTDVTGAGAERGPAPDHCGNPETTRPAVVSVRYRPGVAGHAARTVHLVSRPGSLADGSVVNALCGALLACEQIETTTPASDMPCTVCLLLRSSSAPGQPPALPAEPQPDDSKGAATPPLATAASYRSWGWPVSLRRDQVTLDLDDQVVAIILPTDLATEVTAILATRHCPVPALAHPYAPTHRVLLAGEPFGTVLPWPAQVQQGAGTLPLPPTATPRGPITWVRTPQPDALRLCREIDLFAAVRTALGDSKPHRA